MGVFIDRVGEERYNNQNIKMKIIAYRNCEDLDVQFEDGYIAYNKRYGSFKRGEIKHPNYKHSGTLNRIGEVSYASSGEKMTIIAYRNNADIDIVFEDGTIVKHKTYQQFKLGKIKNRNYYKNKRIGETVVLSRYRNISAEIIDYKDAKNITVYIKDLDEIITTNYTSFSKAEIRPKNYKTICNRGISSKPDTESRRDALITWRSMMERCYSEVHLNKNETYKGCIVCDEWHNFQNFAKWYDENYYEIPGHTMCLDKDILIKGNKIYSPETCVFVSHDINTLFTKSNKTRGDLPIGVSYDKRRNSYESYISYYGRKKYLGNYKNKYDAFDMYKKSKENYIKEVADKYEKYIPEKLYNAMYKYEVELTD